MTENNTIRMTQSYMIVYEEPLGSEDLKLLLNAEGAKIEIPLPERIPGAQFISFGTAPFLRLGQLNGGNLLIGNIRYRDVVHGALQFDIGSQLTGSECDAKFNTFLAAVRNFGLGKEIYAYELNFRMESRDFIFKYCKIDNLGIKTMASPMTIGIRIFEGEADDGNSFLKCWREIGIQPDPADLGKIIVVATYRVSPKELSAFKVEDVFSDIDSVVNRFASKKVS
ncbi:MAG: hypothetical protein JRN15_20510 [Nitrososphaerota archaeon]|nr:hypothetical protein [Nitrososphaerota archaeon]